MEPEVNNAQILILPPFCGLYFIYFILYIPEHVSQGSVIVSRIHEATSFASVLSNQTQTLIKKSFSKASGYNFQPQPQLKSSVPAPEVERKKEQERQIESLLEASSLAH